MTSSTVKRFIPDVKNNVCTVDENGITPLMKCSDTQECFYMCDILNEVKEHDRMANNRNNSAASRARDYS
jgi:hypothetical protein